MEPSPGSLSPGVIYLSQMGHVFTQIRYRNTTLGFSSEYWECPTRAEMETQFPFFFQSKFLCGPNPCRRAEASLANRF